MPSCKKQSQNDDLLNEEQIVTFETIDKADHRPCTVGQPSTSQLDFNIDGQHQIVNIDINEHQMNYKTDL